ncbi:hypothetical protein VAR608DRAFT_4885 [Variovorax sp. HW608]|uniref:DUF2290 domain-containing protein n=1 Tax=Variovorax sp. HW608 TaxID=1034889 RepID=UPI0008201F32|nr:DUF2290 domain-containing protein [Variovorax sp. HW608]SCK49130.1 hypothetical protein VAR608DRAFT_4885 [Variovorax sp. HW608]
MNFARTCQGLGSARSYFSRNSLTQVDNIAINTQLREISWAGYQAGIIRNTAYPIEYQFLLDNHQYSILLKDGSFFQFYFSFEADELNSARLAFYPRPLPLKDDPSSLSQAAEEALDRGDEEILQYLLNWVELMELEGRLMPSNTSHVRFDYDRDVEAHCKSHLQLGAIQDLRIPANFFPQPLAFIQLCQNLIYGSLPLPSVGLGFERNHLFALERPDFLITLGCQ